MKHLITAIALACALAHPAIAQQKPADHSAHHPAAAASATASAIASAADMTEGEIRKIDRKTKKITIKHGDIRNLDMPAMTMAFQVIDASKLKKLKAGDKILFVVEKRATGLVVTDIRPAP